MASNVNKQYSESILREVTSEVGRVRSSMTRNVGNSERLASVAAGGFLALYGLNRPSFAGLLLSTCGAALLYRGFTGHCHGYSVLGISSNRSEDSATSVPAQMGVKIEKSLLINCKAEDLYDRWRNLSTFPQIMLHLKSVTELGDGRSHWIAQGPLGVSAEWDAELINEEQPRLMAWQSLPDSQVDTAGSVRFEELSNDRGTKLTVSLKYNPPGGQIGTGIAWLFGGGIEQEIDADLRRFKQIMETGEAATTEGQPAGR